MPNTIEDKISLFTKVIIERIELDCEKKQKKLVEYHENRKNAMINDVEERKRTALERAIKDAQTKKQQLILKTRSAMHLAVLQKRQEFSERVTKEVKRKVSAFVNTEEYGKFLAKAIKQVLARFSENQFIHCNFSRNDFKNRQELIAKTIQSCRKEGTYQMDAADHLIGGVFIKSGDGRLEVDFTINTMLEESDKLIGEVLSSRLNKES
ncbi:MAG: H(+)-transporting ATPase [Calditrichaeota bacterium]|nr:MAG: H(+)-transporting ATPase [Calditrichota bacterium]